MTPFPGNGLRTRSPHRVYLLDDHAIVRHGLKTLLESEQGFLVVGESSEGARATEQIRAARPDVVVVDAQLDDGSALAVCRDLRDGKPPIPTLVLSEVDGETLMDALVAGASGFVLKSIEPSAFLNAAHMVASGHSLVDSRLTAQVLGRQDRSALAAEFPQLTPRERRVLGLISEGMTNREIARTLHLSEHTIKNHVTHVLAKLGVERRGHAALLASTPGRSSDEN